MSKQKIIAAVRSEEEFLTALQSKLSIIFWLTPNLLTVADYVSRAHKAGKKLFVHMDLAEGIGKDRAGMQFLKAIGVDGIITTRSNIVKMARDQGLFTIQRFFVVDSQSLETAIETVKSSKADMLEVLPGVVPKVITTLKEKLAISIIAGGLIETKEELQMVLDSGVFAVSTGHIDFWK
ncbi:MAG: glycerol-3-phosphate responsive antiterminator [Clostridia bacterium]|nr:glycerol-3-phosphate responsive antiterminator [Clostridia bacterium]